MNPIQLFSKIKTKSDDLQQNIQQMLLIHEVSAIDKDLLKKQCLDLYELILKLKTGDENGVVLPEPDRFQIKPEDLVKESPVEKVVAVNDFQPEQLEPEPLAEIEPFVVNEFKDLFQSDTKELTLDEIEAKVVIPAPEDDPDLPPLPENFAPYIKSHEHTIQEPEPIYMEPPTPKVFEGAGFEINIEKAVENKRIQKTVLPAIEEQKTVPLNQVFKEREATFNDKSAKEVGLNPIVEKSLEAPIDSIKSAITLNKKISFVNELFKENVVEYAKAIDRLNMANDRTDAFRVFNELKHQFQWQTENELVNEMERLIKRRFAS